MGSSENATRLLARMQAGDAGATAELMALLDDELRSLAAARLRSERRSHTLQATALVNEAYLKLIHQTGVDYRSRAHFLAVAALMMRRILVNHAQARGAAKRGGAASRVPLADEHLASGAVDVDVLALDEALHRLAQRDPRKARVVEQRYFGGMDMSQIAENLGVSLATVKRDWEYARLWLAREIDADDS